MGHIKQNERERLKHLKEYLEGWDFEVEPWFTIPEEDAKIILRAIDQYEKGLDLKKRQQRRRRMERKSSKLLDR